MLRSTILLFIFFSTNIQAQTLSGTVRSEYGTVIPYIDVSINGADKSMTDDTGEFELDLSNCAHCIPGNTVSIIVYNDDYGFHKIEKTLNNNHWTFLEIEKKPNIVGITGVVKDSESQQLLKGISVKLISTSFSDVIPPVITDDHGSFVIILQKEILGPIQYVELICKDANDKYLDKKEAKNISAPFEILMDRGGKKIDLEINTLIKIDVHIRAGDFIKISATGNIKVGPWVGHSSPEGRSSGFLGGDLSSYSIVPNLNHAALLYRFSGDETWNFVGKEIEFHAPRSGYLEFEVNDRGKENNYGSYQVKLTIQ